MNQSFKNKLFVLVTLFAMFVSALGVTSAQAASTWEQVGLAGFSAGGAFYPSLGIDSTGIPYVAYMDTINSNKASVMKFNGTAWVQVGSAGFSAGGANNTSLVIDSANTPYVGYSDGANSNKTSVMKFNGTDWVQVGSAGFSAGGAEQPWLAIDSNDTLYLAYRDNGTSSKLSVMKFDGTDWVQVGSAGFSAGSIYSPSLAFDSADTPYVAYKDGGSNKASVMKFDGTDWVQVGSAGFSPAGVNSPSLVIDSTNTPYVGYEDANSSYKTSVMKFNGTDWVQVGSAGFSPASPGYSRMAIDSNDLPYIAYQDGSNGNKASMMMFDGANWVQVGSAGFSAGTESPFPSIAFYNNSVYVAYRDGANGYKASVMKYSFPAAPTVSTDSIETLDQRKVYATLSDLGTPRLCQRYGVVYSTSSGPTTSDSKVDKGATTSTGAYNVGLGEMSLTAGTKYYVRAFATNATDTSYGAELVVYGTPGDFTQIAPANNATDVSTSPTLSWNASTGARDYEYCVQPLLANCTGSNLSGPNWISTGGATYVDLSGLSSSTNYAWGVRAVVGTPASYSIATNAPSYFTTSAAPSTYTVTFNANDGSGSMSPQVSNAPAALTSNTFTRSGYTFAGWNTAANGSGTAYANGASYAFTADVTLYAQWTLSTPTFTDVPLTYWAANYIERLSNAGITSGCGAGSYCPDSTVTRAQMAVFLLKGMYGSSYAPPAVGVSTGFGDVATDYWAAAWIKQLAAEGITSGCGAGNYCPDTTVTRTQMAIFLLKAKNGSSYTPPAVGASTGFNDVATDAFGAAYIKQLVADGITAGCGNSNYCPNDSVTRAQMAVFIVKAFNLP